MSEPLLQAGALIDDHWRLERELSAGATSSVWEAENLRLEGKVAIKFLLQQHAADPTERERFLRETKAICKIRSPHVVQVLERGISHGLPYLVMELLEGEDMARLLARERMLSLTETASMLDQLCRGLGKAHSSGFVHRDVKPENVFVIHENDGGHFIKLLDFGIAKLLDAGEQPLTQREMVVGTAHYLSPEQIERPRDVDARADVWAVGVLAYRMLLGKDAFDAASWQEVCARILLGKYAAPTTQRAGLPAEIDLWFQQALARDRTARFQTAQAASAALSGIARRSASGILDRPIVQSEPPEYAITALARTAPPGRPQLLRRRAIALGAVAVALLSAWSWWALRPRPDASPVKTAAPPSASPPIAAGAGEASSSAVHDERTADAPQRPAASDQQPPPSASHDEHAPVLNRKRAANPTTAATKPTSESQQIDLAEEQLAPSRSSPPRAAGPSHVRRQKTALVPTAPPSPALKDRGF